MKKLSIFALIASALMVTSCDLDEHMQAQADKNMIFGSETGLKMYIDGLYGQLPGQIHYADEALCDWGVNNSINTYELGAYGEDLSTSWSWGNIRTNNYFIKWNTDARVDEKVRNNYTGIAKFFRAYQYFDKLKQYGAVPIITEPLEPDSEDLYKAQDSREDVVNFILDDLQWAYEHITTSNATPNNVAINKWTAMALKARVALFEASWRKYHAGTAYTAGCTTSADQLYAVAAAAAKEIMDKGPYALYTGTKNGTGEAGNGRGTYRDLFTSETTQGNPEVMLAYEITAPSTGEANWRLNSSSYGSHLCLSRIFAQTFLNTDGTFFNEKNADGTYKTFVEECANRDWRLYQVIRGPKYTWKINDQFTIEPANFKDHTYTGYQLTKFVYDDKNMDDKSSGTYDDPLLRYAEILLIYAEAKAELGTITDAEWAQTIGALRARAGITAGLDKVPSVKDPLLVKYYGDLSAAVLEVRRERAIELIMEGHRQVDLKRWACGELWETMPWEGVYVPALDTQIDMNGDGVMDVYFTSKKADELSKEDGKIAAYLNENQTMKKLEDDPKGGYVMYYAYGDRRVWNDNMYLYPIPTQVGIMNPNLTQNPGRKKTW
ncbi:MAG: RagB/SusD family nutrient uptake outer membrane protein [Alistipes sp.]|nr:RagB/SusD family nutrient uptake outer membrane protein [Alistipes sp.]